MIREAKAVLWDLDGTLVDSAADIHAALAAAMRGDGLPEPTLAQTTSWIGGGVNKLVERALPRDPARAASVVARFRDAYAAAPAVLTTVYDGIPDVLDRIAVPIAIVTNKPHDLAVAIAAAVLGQWRFVVVDGQRPGFALKPSPEPALRVAAQLGVAPADCVFVGDSDVDVLSARAAGMRVIGAAWGYRPRAELMDAHVVADRPRELLALV